MNKQDLKVQQQLQTCVLKVNIQCDCEGCMHKVRKTLQKVEGVYKVNIDGEQGKVTVSGNVDPSILIKKLEKSGKHAELWGPQKGPISILNSQFKNFQMEKSSNNGGKDGKFQKGIKDLQKGGLQVPPQMMNLKKGSKDVGIVGKKQNNSVRFDLPEDEEDDSDFDEFEDDDDEFDDEFDEGFGAHEPPSKVAHGKAKPKGDAKGKKGAKNGGNGKKNGGINMFIKGILGKAGGKSDKVGKSHNKEGNKNEGGEKKGKNKNNGFVPRGGKDDGFVMVEGKSGAVNGKGGGGGGGKANDGWSKKVGENFDGGRKMESKNQGFNEMNPNHKGGGGGKNMGAMGQMGEFSAVQGLPAMNGGNNFPGAGQGNPYNQQQYMNMMMMMNNQQHGIRPDAYHPAMYARPPAPPPGVSYGPHMGNDQYTHMFNDENTESCSIM